jgi:hypothetical protein
MEKGLIMSNTIKLDCYGIEINLTGDGGGSISSNLHGIPIDSSYHEEELSARYNDMMDALESIILAHACAGIDVTTPAYMEGIETACQACAKATE